MFGLLHFAAPLIAALPFLVLALRVLVGHRDPIYSGDAGLLALGVQDAAHGARAVGPYSQFGFFHPGPALFYALTPFEWLTADAPWSIPLGIEVLNAIVAASLVWIVQISGLSVISWRQEDRSSAAHLDKDRNLVLGFVAASAVIGYSLAVGYGLLQIFWNPIQIMLPTASLLVVVALTERLGWSAALALLAATFAIQTDLSTIPVVGAALLCGLIFVGWDLWRSQRLRSTRQEGARSRWRHPGRIAGPLVVSSLAVLAWIPPLVQQLTNHPGNAGKLISFFTSPNPSHPSWSQATAYLGRQLAVIPERVQDFGPLSMAAAHGHRGQAQFGLFLALSAGLIAVGAISRSAPLTRLGVVSLVSALAALVSITAIRGQGGWYYTAWMSAIAVPLLLGWSVVIVDIVPRLGRVLVPTVLAAVSIAALIASSTTPIDDSAAFPNEPGYRANTLEAWRLISGPLSRMGIKRVVLGGDPALMPMLSGVALRMAMTGIEVSVPSTLVPPFGPEEESHPDTKPAVLISISDPGSGYGVVGRVPSLVPGFPAAIVSLARSLVRPPS